MGCGKDRDVYYTQDERRGQTPKPLEHTLREMARDSEAPMPSKITRRIDVGLESLGQLHGKLDEILMRLRAPGLEGQTDTFRLSASSLNVKADEILERL